jgi:hypothetical protein
MMVLSGNWIALAVHHRVRLPREERQLAGAAQAVIDALGRRRRLSFAYEEALGRMTSRQQAAYFDLGVEHGAAAARADVLHARPAVRKLADRLVREALGANVPRGDVAAAAVLAALAMIGARTARRILSAPARARAPA